MGRLAQRAGLMLGFAVTAACDQHHQCPAGSAGSCEMVAPPVIDISALISSDDHSTVEWNTAAEAVARACEEWGFFQVWAARSSLLSSPNFPAYVHIRHLGNHNAGTWSGPTAGHTGTCFPGLMRYMLCSILLAEAY